MGCIIFGVRHGPLCSIPMPSDVGAFEELGVTNIIMIGLHQKMKYAYHVITCFSNGKTKTFTAPITKFNFVIPNVMEETSEILESLWGRLVLIQGQPIGIRVTGAMLPIKPTFPYCPLKSYLHKARASCLTDTSDPTLLTDSSVGAMPAQSSSIIYKNQSLNSFWEIFN